MLIRTLLCGIATVLAIGVPAHGENSGYTNCASLNSKLGPYNYGLLDPNKKQHITGNHSWANVMSGTCSYTGTAAYGAAVPCKVHVTASSSSGAGDTGVTTPYWHTATPKDAQGLTDGPAGGTAVADAEGVTAVESCAIFPCGSVGISINGAGTGGGFTVSTNPTSYLWGDQRHYANTSCTGYTLNPIPVTTCATPNPPYPPYQTYGATWTWNIYTCQWDNTQGASPVIFDTKGKGFEFTDPAKGDYVSFDIAGDGIFLKVSWPEHNSGNAWLVLDRDGDGIIKDGTELFGNFTPHSDGGDPTHPNPNGFLALAWYDQPAQGGDMNLILDKRDAIWPKLKLWKDGHCYKEPDKPCRSLSSELHTLESEGVTSISLLWDVSPKTDAVGNKFKFFVVVNPEAATTLKDEHGNSCCDLHRKSKDGRLAYDVYLKTTN